MVGFVGDHDQRRHRIIRLLLAAYGLELVRRNLDVEATSVPLSMAWLYLPLLLGGLSTALQAIAESAEMVMRLRAGLHPGGEQPS